MITVLLGFEVDNQFEKILNEILWKFQKEYITGVARTQVEKLLVKNYCDFVAELFTEVGLVNP